MNKERRKQIESAIKLLTDAKDAFEQARDLIESAKDEEQDYFDNMPESFQQGERGQRAEEVVQALESALDPLNDLDLDDVIGNLETAVE